MVVQSFTQDVQTLEDAKRYETLIKIVESVYGSPDSFVHEETPIHMELSNFIGRHLVETHIPSSLVKRFPSLAVNMTLGMPQILFALKTKIEGHSKQIKACASRVRTEH